MRPSKNLVPLVLAAISAMGAGIIAADPSTLGLPPVLSAWIAILMLGLQAITAFLPKVGP